MGSGVDFNNNAALLEWTQSDFDGRELSNLEENLRIACATSAAQNIIGGISSGAHTTVPSLVKRSPSGRYVLQSLPSDHGFGSNTSSHSSGYSSPGKDEMTGANNPAFADQSFLNGSATLGHRIQHFGSQTRQAVIGNQLTETGRNVSSVSNGTRQASETRGVGHNQFANAGIARQLGTRSTAYPPLSSLLAGGDSNMNVYNSYRKTPGAPSDIAQFIMGADEKEVFARKVFVGGLPIDVKEEEIYQTFQQFGPVLVDWPRRPDSKEASSIVPMSGYSAGSNARHMTGYVFLVFEEERSVQLLVNECHCEGGRYYLFVSSPTMRDKPVQVRPWRLSDMDYCPDGLMQMCPRRTVFIGGVPRPTRAQELALVLNRHFGHVCYVGIDIDPELKYPKGAARVTFSTNEAFVSAITGRFVSIPHAETHKRFQVEIKPYVMDEQMCDECEGRRCSGRYAPYFCGDVSCLSYYCENCWDDVHGSGSTPGKRTGHKPLVRCGDQTKLLPRPPHHLTRNSTGILGTSTRTRLY